MKKIVCLICIVLMALCMAGCGDPSTKEQCDNIAKKYSKLLDDAQNEYSTVNAPDYSKELLNASEKLTLRMKNIQQQLEQEKINDDGKNYLEAWKNFLKASVEFQTNGTEELRAVLNGKDGSGFRKRAKIAEEEGYKLIYVIMNEASKIKTGHEIYKVKYGGKCYKAYEASNVFMALTGYRLDPNYLGDNIYFRVVPAGKFITIGIVVKNNQKDAITVDANSFKLIDSKGREYTHSVDGMMALSMEEQNTKGFLSNLNPGLMMKIKCVYDIPKDTNLKDLKISARGGLSGRTVEIPLEVEELPSI